MGIKVANNAFGTLASSITNSATSITLTTGQGARFPTLSAGDYFYATLIDTSNNLEIVKCTARSTDVLTVTRAQENTTARAYSAGDRIEIRITAATFEEATAVENGEITEAKIASGAVTAAKLASGAAVSNIGYTPVNKAGDTITGALNVSGILKSRTSILATPAYGGNISVSGSIDESRSIFMPQFHGSGNVNLTYRHCFNIDSNNFSVHFTGGGGNTVFGTWAHIMADHYMDMYIRTETLYYSDLKIKIVSDGNANLSIWVAGDTYANNVYGLSWTIYPHTLCTITMNPDSSQSFCHMVHYASGGNQESGTSTATSGSGPSSW